MQTTNNQQPNKILTFKEVETMKSRGLDISQIEAMAAERNMSMPSDITPTTSKDSWFKRAVSKVGQITGTEALGKGLAYSLFRATPEYKELEKLMQSGQISPDEFVTLTTGDLTNKDVAASAVRTAGTILSAGQYGKTIVPKMSKGLAATGNVKRGIKIGAGIGATVGGGKGIVAGIDEGQGLLNTLGSGLEGAITGGAVGAGLGAVGGTVSGGAFLEGAKAGAKAGAIGGSIYGGSAGLAESIEEGQDLSDASAGVLGGAIGSGVRGGIFGGLIGGVTSSIGQSIQNKISRKNTLKQALQQESQRLQTTTPKTAPYTLNKGNLGKDRAFTKAVRDTGIAPNELAIIKGSQADDLVAYKKMIDVANIDDPLNVQRPVQVAGETVNQRIKDVIQVKNQAGKEIGKIAQQKLNKAIPGLTDAVDEFADNLSSQGVTVSTGGRLDFQGSVFDDMPEIQRSLKTIFKRAQAMGTNGKTAHDLKRYIYERVNYDISTSGLTNTAQSLMKSFARGIDTVLDTADASYKVANNRFSTAISAQLDVQKILGKGFNVADEYATMKSGQVMSRILGNASANPLQVLSDLEKATSDLGFQYKNNIIAQIKFADMLDDIVGPPSRSLSGQVERAANRVFSLRDLSSDVLEKGGAVLKKALEKTPAERLDALSNYINVLSK